MSRWQLGISYPFVFAETPNVEVNVFGKPGNYRVGDWSDPNRFAPIAEVAETLGISDLYVPDPRKFNTRVVSTKEFREKIKLGKTWVHYGIEADGLVLESGQAGVIISGDCPTLTVSVPGDDPIVLMAHAGCDSLLHKPFGEVPSVVENLLTCIPKDRRRDAEGLVSCHIQADNFSYPLDDPNFGAINIQRRLFLDGQYPEFRSQILPDGLDGSRIDLFRIIAAQLIQGGVPDWNIHDDGLNTFTDSDYWSHRREGTAGRNAVIAVHKR